MNQVATPMTHLSIRMDVLKGDPTSEPTVVVDFPLGKSHKSPSTNPGLWWISLPHYPLVMSK